MIIAPRIAEKFDSLSLKYDLIARTEFATLYQAAEQLGLNKSCIARSIVLGLDDYLCLIVVPSDALIDFNELKALTQRDLEFISLDKVKDLFPDCEPGCVPPIGDLYKMETYFDSRLLKASSVIFEAGSQNCLLRLSNLEFSKVMQQHQHGQIATPVSELKLKHASESLSSANHSWFEFETMDEYQYRALLPLKTANASDLEQESCPSLPKLASRIMSLQSEKEFDFRVLKELLDSDPKLYDRIVKIVSSSLFSRVTPLNEDSPERTLLHGPMYTLVLGLVILNEFQVNTAGTLNTRAIYLHALMSTSMALKLANELNESGVISQSLLILSGLLQNIGLLYYGQQHKDRFFLLDKLVSTNPDKDLLKLESLINTGQGLESLNSAESEDQNNTNNQLVYHHAMIGAALIQDWRLPDEVVHSVRYHHDIDYKLEYFQYPNLLLLANCLLISDRDEPPEACRLSKALFERIRISPAACSHSAIRFHKQCQTLPEDLRVGGKFKAVF